MTIGDIVLFALILSVAWNEGIRHKDLKDANCASIEKNVRTKEWAERMKKHFQSYIIRDMPKPRPL